jgi:UrcA family protein
MTTFTAARPAASRAKFALLMITGGLVGALGVGAINAASVDSDGPSVAIRYSAADLANDDTVRALYHRIVKAAEQVCPQVQTGTMLVSAAVRQCREQAVEHTVQKINDPRLAALHASGSKNT